jgi:acetyltransferase-like isoleucine patch superfamily enzyme
MQGERIQLADDWYRGGVPGNVVLGRDAYVDSSYSFAAFQSEQCPGLTLGDACGAYDRMAFVVGPQGRISVGSYTVLNGTYLICNERITIGSHCLLAWGSVLTDSWIGTGVPPAARRAVLRAAAADPVRRLPPVSTPRPILVEDNVWVGFDAVILPGVTLGRGCIVGCKCVIAENIAPYTVVVGEPPRVVRHLDPDDGGAAQETALLQYSRR